MKLWKLLQSAMLLLAFTTMVSCVDDNDDMGAPSLEVSPTSLTFGEDGVAADGNVIIVVSNRVWSAEVQKGADWVTISQIEGEGDGKIEVSVPAGESAMATITIAISNPMGILMKEEVTIVRGKGTVTPPLEDAIFNETFGSMAVASPYPYIDQYTDFKMSGSGSEGVTYEGAGMSVRKAAKSNTGAYVYASGPNELFFGTTATAGTSFIVKAITLPEAKTDFLLTAGGTYYDYDSKDNTFNTENFIIELSGDGKSWSPITYTKSDGDTKEPFWTYLTANFTLKVASAKLYIKYTAMEKSKFRMDDVTLFEGNGGQEVDLAGGSVDPDPEPEPVDAIYNETFGTMTVASPYPLVGDYTDFTKSGSGAADVTYEGVGSISMRASGKSSSGAYAAASGPNVAFFGTFAEGATSSSFIVKNITLPADKKNFTLSWGGNYYNYDAKDNVFNPANFTAELSGDGTTWVPITYTKTNGDVTDPFWTYITSTFSLKAASAKLFVRYTATEESRFRMDDITLVESATAGTEVDLGGGSVDPDPEPVDAVYYESFGTWAKPDTDKYWPYVTDYTDYKKQGTGAANVTYDGYGTSVRGTGAKNVGTYEGASGPNAVFFSKVDAVKGCYVTIGNIALPAGKTNYTLSFGGSHYQAAFEVANMNISLSGDGTTWVPLTYTVDAPVNPYPADTDKWQLAKVTFTLKAASEVLYIKYGATVDSKLRVDDVKLVVSATAGTEIDLGGGGTAPDPVPTISANPASLSFVAAGASQDIACTVTNQGENVVAASSNNAHFTTLVSGTTVSVTAPANTTTSAISGVITLTLGSASTTVAVSQAAETGGGEGNVKTFDLTTGYVHEAPIPSVTLDPITITFDKGTASIPPRYWTNQMRAYKGNNMVVTGGTITKVEFSGSALDKITVTEGTIVGGVWTGSSTSLRFDVTATIKVNDIKVTYE